MGPRFLALALLLYAALSLRLPGWCSRFADCSCLEANGRTSRPVRPPSCSRSRPAL
jgi:hypothetical protein